MTDPTQPTDPTDPTEAILRDALQARAEEVAPVHDDPSHLAAAIEADEIARTRRRRTILGTAAAAAVALVIAGVALAGGSGDPEGQVITGTDPTSTSTPATTASTAAPSTTAVPVTSTSVASTSTEVAPITTTSIAPTTTTGPPLPGGSTDPRSGGSSGPLPALLTDLRVGCQGSVSRVVFEFADGAMPEWSVQYVDPPIVEDASGEPVAVAGGAFLQVRLTPAWGHDLDQPDAPATYPGPGRLSGGCGSSLEVVRTGEFEAVYSWVIGVPVRAPFTASTVAGPSRLVIDVAA